jgi:hypothetical protein
MSAETRSPRPRWYLIRFGILMVALSLLVGTGVAAASGTQKPKLKISGVPASVVKGGSFTITATGYSGKFNVLDFFGNAVGPCKSTDLKEAAQQHTSYTVPKNRHFNTAAHTYLLRYRNDVPGTYHVCVYLYKQFNPGGTQLYKSTTYQITP